ncbi:hypothetical protein ACHAWF_011865 [Thalassiosira exigua]
MVTPTRPHLVVVLALAASFRRHEVAARAPRLAFVASPPPPHSSAASGGRDRRLARRRSPPGHGAVDDGGARIVARPLHSRDEADSAASDRDDEGDNDDWRVRIGKSLEGQTSFAKYGRPEDIDESSFGPLLPIAEAVDEATGGWGLSYADLQPATPKTTVGQVFLATNFFYAAAGLWLGFRGDWFYGGLTELAGIVSFVYHYTQLEFGKNRSEVRLALLVDYFCAGSALVTGGVYMIQAGIGSVPVDALLAAGAAAVCLSLCWVWEFGYPYIFWHSLWHVLSAYTGFLVGQEHLVEVAGRAGG